MLDKEKFDSLYKFLNENLNYEEVKDSEYLTVLFKYTNVEEYINIVDEDDYIYILVNLEKLVELIKSIEWYIEEEKENIYNEYIKYNKENAKELNDEEKKDFSKLTVFIYVMYYADYVIKKFLEEILSTVYDELKDEYKKKLEESVNKIRNKIMFNKEEIYNFINWKASVYDNISVFWLKIKRKYYVNKDKENLVEFLIIPKSIKKFIS